MSDRATALQRWEIIREVQGLLTGGAGNGDIVAHLVKTRGFSRTHGYRYLQRAYADWKREAKRLDRGHYLSVALNGRLRAMRLALTAKRWLVVNGQLESHEDPDVKAYISALDSYAKLAGLYEPDRIEVTTKDLWPKIMLIMEAIRARVKDKDTLVAIYRDIQALFDEQHGALVVEARAVDAKTLTNGTNGAAHEEDDVPDDDDASP